MLLHIENVLDAGTFAHLRDRLGSADWHDGRTTAGHQSATAKHNHQLAAEDPLARELGAIVVDALGRNATFFAGALPRRIFPPLFSRYEVGESFGLHVDNAVRYDRTSGAAEPVRTDLSATLFLSDPADYDGGELLIEDSFGVHRVKLPPGDLVLYPGGSLHRVLPITRGQRVAAFFWLQSLVRSADHRRLLFDLDLAIQSLTQEVKQDTTTIALTGIYHNLLREWSDV